MESALREYCNNTGNKMYITLIKILIIFHNLHIKLT